MAKFNIEVVLDWIEEDGTIDEALKDEIVSAVVGRVTEATTKRIDEKISEMVDIQIHSAEQAVCVKLNEIMDDFLNRKRTVTDRYGDVVETDQSVMDMLKKACDSFVEGYVDKNGNSTSSNSYGDKKRRIDYMIEKQIDYKMQKSIEDAAKEIKSGLQKYIDETLKSQIGENVAKIIGLDSMIKKI